MHLVTVAVLLIPLACCAGHTQGTWPFKGGSPIFLSSLQDSTIKAFANTIMPRIVQPQKYTSSFIFAGGGALRNLCEDATGFGYRNYTMMLELGTLAASKEDEKWVDSTLALFTADSKGARFYNHFECLGNDEDPWKVYFDDHAAKLQAIKAQYDPQQQILGMNCSALT